MRNSLFDNIPLSRKSRVSGFNKFDWSRYLFSNGHIASISLLFGAFSHIFWDSFTREHGYFVGVILGLSRTIPLFGKEIPIFKLMQHSSTLIGGFAIILTIFQKTQDATVSMKMGVRFEYGDTPLHFAAGSSFSVSSVKKLLEYGADPKFFKWEQTNSS